MQEPTNIKEKRFNISQDDLLVILICGLIIFGLALVWYWRITLWISIPLTAILGLSLYYQVMVWIKQTSMAMVGMEIEDKMINEFAYQTMKRGHTVRIFNVRDSDDADSDSHYKITTDMPKWKKKYVKTITIIFVILFPAWRYREFEGEDNIWVSDIWEGDVR